MGLEGIVAKRRDSRYRGTRDVAGSARKWRALGLKPARKGDALERPIFALTTVSFLALKKSRKCPQSYAPLASAAERDTVGDQVSLASAAEC